MPKLITNNPINITQGHCWPPTIPQLGSQNVYAENFQVIRVGDAYQQHVPGCTIPPTTHPVIPIMGSPNVFVNNLPVIRDGDPMACGDVADNGSRTIFVNGGGDGSNNQEEETTGYTVDPPILSYSSDNLIIPYIVRLIGGVEQFLGGCETDYRLVEAYSPLNEEDTRVRYKNFPGPPLTVESGANLPRRTSEDRRRPIPITLDSDTNLPGLVRFDPITGNFSGRILVETDLRFEGSEFRIRATNYVGSNTKVLIIRFQKYYDTCP